MRTRLATLSFFFYVLWLLAVPMEGPLLPALEAAGCSRWFLCSHVMTLVVIGRWASPAKLHLFAQIGALATALLTLVLPLAPELAPLLLTMLGFTAAPLSAKACDDLHSARQPIIAAACCLIGANLMLAIIQTTMTMPFWPVVLALLPLLTIPTTTPLTQEDGNRPPLNRSYLVFVFIFQIVSGLMYASLFPAYDVHAFYPGLELPFYMLAAVVAVMVYQRNRDLLLAGALIMAMAAFALLQIGGDTAVNISMFAMQTAVGCIDMFLLALLLTSKRSVATFGYGLAALCGGIAAGQFFKLGLNPTSTLLGLTGGLVLNIAALSLFLRRQHQEHSHLVTSAEITLPALPAEFFGLLSKREMNVLALVLEGKNYREAARELAISESSIKTYMKRICDKIGVSNRSELLQKIGKADRQERQLWNSNGSTI